MRTATICKAGLAVAVAIGILSPPARAEEAKPKTTAELLDASAPSDWRQPDPASTLVMELPAGRVVIELAPQFTPKLVENIRTLARERYWDGLAIVRVHENYVVQWGDPDSDDPARKRSLGSASETIAPEFSRPSEGLAFTALADGDVYAPEVGHVDGLPAARDPASGGAWLAHCYGMVGAGRGETADSGSGASLYVVIGHAPRHLDRNSALVGRVLQGMEHLTRYPRGTGNLGFYERPEQRIPITTVRLASDLPADAQPKIEVLRTDTALYQELLALRRNRVGGWWLVAAGKTDLCNAPLPVRDAKKP